MCPHPVIPLYQPQVRICPIYHKHPGNRPLLQYTHDIDIVRFQGRFLAAWNANTGTVIESAPGQYNYVSDSNDFEHWRQPIKMFSDTACCDNPILTDNQWQPSFVNQTEEMLYCAWCDFNARKLFVAHTRDGRRWHNREVATAPPGLEGRVLGFPTNHGLVTRKGTLLIPCSLAQIEAKLTPRHTRYAALLRSTDGGHSWQWGRPLEAASWEAVGEDSARFGGSFVAIWEPAVYECADGRLGVLIRNSTAQDATPPRFEAPHRMLWHAESEDEGHTWTTARPIELDTICSRNFTARVPDSEGLIMVMNDHWVGVPRPICHDRYHLALFCGPTADPNLLLPGPRVQAVGGRAYYPNGFIADNRLYLGYSCLGGMYGSAVSPLPDYNRPFLLPRESRGGLEVTESKICLAYPENSIGCVLTADLTRHPTLRFAFAFSVHQYNGEPFPLLTIGGKTMSGAVFRVRYCPTHEADILDVQPTSSPAQVIMPIRSGTRHHLELLLTPLGMDLVCDARTRTSVSCDPLLRKISFGGLYEPPEWPVGMRWPARIEIERASVQVGT